MFAKRGTRLIQVDERRFRWCWTGRGSISVEPEKGGRRLFAPAPWGRWPRPRDVARLIRYALAQGWDPDHDSQDYRLSSCAHLLTPTAWESLQQRVVRAASLLRTRK